MSKAPGYQKWPEHKIATRPLGERVQVEINGEVIADSRDVIEMDEDRHPRRYYFPRPDVRMDKLERSQTTTECPFKGIAHYYSVRVGDTSFADAVWTYEVPYDEQRAIKERLAFYDDKIPAIHIRVGV